ncbi:MAG: nicotinate-nucleotide adenylyltransferase [Burkholderiaceae bacterium]
MKPDAVPRCIVLLGGSFDPVHAGHVALARYLAVLLAPDELRLIPAGNPWQKAPLRAAAQERIDMLRLALDSLHVPLVVDRREIERDGPTYTIDTLRSLRAELGPAPSLVLAIGADQLLRLDTWREWPALFDHANLCVAPRPGFDTAAMPDAVKREFSRRAATPAQLRATPHGLACIASGLAWDVSSTALRDTLARGGNPGSLLPAPVLDYIERHHLYRS